MSAGVAAVPLPALAAWRRTGRGAGGLARGFAVEFVARVDVDAGVAWALGAWAKDAGAVSGDLAALLGAEHGEIVARAVDAGSFSGKWAARRAARRAPLGVAGGAWARPVDAGDPLGRALSFADPEVPLTYLCDGLRLAPSNGKISLIAGNPGAGKGPIADHLAVCFAFGLPAFGRFPCTRSRVLLLDAEGARLTMRRMRRMCRALGVDAKALPDVRDVSGANLLDDRVFYALEAERPEVVVLDSYTSAMMATGLDPNKIEFARLAQMLGALDVLVVAVAHARKPASTAHGERPALADVAGSGALGAMAATAISVWRPDDEAPARVRVGCMRAPETPFATFDVEFTDTPGDGLGVAVAVAAAAPALGDERRAALETTAARVLAFMRAHSAIPKAATAIADGIGEGGGQGRARVGGILAALERAGFVMRHPSSNARGAGDLQILPGAPEAVAFDASGECQAAARGGASVGGFAQRPRG